jgi:hypothetical protein
MTPTEIAKLQQENAILKQALQSSIDYHHHIGNDDCPYSVNQILVTLYKIAEKGLKDADEVKVQPVLNPVDTNGLFEAIGVICKDYNDKINKK